MLTEGLGNLYYFEDNNLGYIFYSYFNAIPTKLELSNLTRNFYKNLPISFKVIYAEHYDTDKELYKKLLVNCNNQVLAVTTEASDFDIYYNINKTPKQLILDLIALAKKHQKRYKKTEYVPEIKLVISSIDGISTISREFKFDKLNKEQIQIHYGDKFLDVYDKLLEFFNQNKGLVLLHGIPGSGKSTIIKQLIADSLDNSMLYLSPESINCIGSPTFTKFLLRHTNSTLLAEDAECVLMKQEFREQATTNLLNLTDGILASVLNTKIIATFNTEITKLDNALLRPGRLYLKHEFNKLTIEESNRFLEYYDSTTRVTEEKVLAELFEYV